MNGDNFSLYIQINCVYFIHIDTHRKFSLKSSSTISGMIIVFINFTVCILDYHSDLSVKNGLIRAPEIIIRNDDDYYDIFISFHVGIILDISYSQVNKDSPISG